MKGKILLKVLLGILILTLTLGLLLTLRKKEEPKGFIFKATKDSTILYFVGHLWNPPNDVNTFTRRVKKIASESDVLLVEMDRVLDSTYSFTSNKVPQDISNKTVLEILNEEELNLLNSICKMLDMDYDSFINTTLDDSIKIFGKHIRSYFTNPDKTLELHLTKYFYKRDKPAYEFEGHEYQQTLAKQLVNKAFNSDKSSEDFLKQMLAGFNEITIKNGFEFFEGQEKAYLTGDLSVLYESMNSLKNRDLELYNLIISDRNKSSFERLEKLIEPNKTNLISIRVNQLLLEDGLLKMFEDAGYEIEPYYE